MAASLSSQCHIHGPPGLISALLQFQREGVEFGIRKNGRCLIGDEMGLGKTLQALAIACHYRDEWPLLIVVPSSVKFSWIEEIEKWLPDINPHDINLIRSGTDVSNIGSSKISVVSYGLFGQRRTSKLLLNCLKEQQFKVMIIDESHYLKNRLADRTKNLYPLAKKADRVILLSGTPSLARPEELYIQLDTVKPGLFGSFSKFANEYCEAHMEYLCGGKVRKWNTRGASNLDKLHKILKEHVMIRRLKKEVLTQLPPKRRQKVTFDISDSDYKKDLDKVMKEFRYYQNMMKSNKESDIFQENMTESPMFELKKLSCQLYHYTGLAKAAVVQHYITDLLDGMENKFLVFCRHQLVMKAVQETLTKKKMHYIRIAGDVPSGVRGELVHRFQSDAKTRVALLSIEAASCGITLTAADHVVFAELHYTPGMMMQAEDRAHRIGQENAVNVHYLVARGTIDEMLWSMLCRKISVTSTALDGKLQMFTAEVGDEEKAREMATCSAWVPMDDSEVNMEEEFLFPVEQKKSMRDRNQSDLRSFFSATKEGTNDSQLNDSQSPSSERKQRESIPKGKSNRKRKNSNTIINEVISSDDDVLEIGCPFLENSSKTCQKSSQSEGEKHSAGVLGKEERGDREASSSQSSGTTTSQHCNILGQDLPKVTSNSVQEPKKVRRPEGEPEQKRKESVKSLDEPLKVDETESAKQLSVSSPTLPHPDKNNTDRECLLSKTLLPPVLNNLGKSSERRGRTSFCESSVKTRTGNGANNAVIVLTDESKDMIPNSLIGATETTPRKFNRTKLKSSSSYGFSPLPLGKKCLAGSRRNHSAPSSPEIVVRTTTKSPCTSSPIIDDVEDSDDFQCAKPIRVYSETISHSRKAKKHESPKYPKKSGSQESVSESGENLVFVSHKGSFDNDDNGSKSVTTKNFERTPPEWSCSACTFLNDSQMIECSLCFTPRRRSQRRFLHERRAATKYNDKGNSRRQHLCNKRKRCYQSYETDTLNECGITHHTDVFVCLKTKQKGDNLSSEISKKRNDLIKNTSDSGTLTSGSNGGICTLKVANKCDVQMQKEDSTETSTNSERVQEWLSDVTVVLETSDEDCNSSSSSLYSEATTEEEQCFVPRKRLKLNENSRASPVTISEFSSDEELSLIDNCLVNPETVVIDENTDNVENFTYETKCTTEEDAIVSDILNTSEEWMQDDDYWQCVKCHSYNFEDETCSQCNVPRNKFKNSFRVSQVGNDVLREEEIEKLLRKSDVELQSSYQSSGASSGVMSCNKQNNLMEINEVTDQSFTGDNPYLCVQPQGSSTELKQSQAVFSLPDESEAPETTVEVHEDTEKPEKMILQFSMSRYTDRVYLYDEDGKALNINFLLSDVENRNMEELPVLFSEEFNFRQALKLVREWKSLGEGKKRVVCKSGLIFSSAIAAYENEKNNQRQKPSFLRHSTKEMRLKKVQDAASEIGGDVRVVTRPPIQKKRKFPGNNEIPDSAYQLSSNDGSALSKKSPGSSASTEHTNIQAVGPDGVPLCLYCLGPVTHANLGTAWEARFCSYNCKEEHEVRVSGSGVRRKLYEEEQGICQICGVNAHAQYQSIKSLPVKDRCTFLAKSSYASLPARVLNKMITDPKEGMFWEADHITPVAEGGGQCGLDNYRTLCIPCHRIVTANLNRRLKQRKMRKSGYGNITDFFGP